MVSEFFTAVWFLVVAALGTGEDVRDLDAWLLGVDDIFAAFGGTLAVVGVAAVASSGLASTGRVAGSTWRGPGTPAGPVGACVGAEVGTLL